LIKNPPALQDGCHIIGNGSPMAVGVDFFADEILAALDILVKCDPKHRLAGGV